MAAFQFPTVSIIKPQQRKHKLRCVNKENNLPVELVSVGTGHMSYAEHYSVPAVLVWLDYG